jgi:hypothetical protein
MFQWFKKRREANQLLNNIKEHTVLGPVWECLNIEINDKRYVISNCSRDTKAKLIINILSDIERNLHTAQPIMSLRARAAELMFVTGELDAMVMKPPTRSRFISGELCKSILELAEKHDYLSQLCYEHGVDTNDYNDVWNTTLMEYQKLHLFVNSYGRALTLMKDRPANEDRDWFHSCYVSFCVAGEDVSRKLLGLPGLIDKNDLRNIAKRLHHQSWIDLLAQERVALRKAWEDSWIKQFGDRDWA